jgi:hypothetical protein
MNIVELRDYSLVLIKAKKNRSSIDVLESKTIEFEDGYKATILNPENSAKLIQSIRHFFNHDRDCLLCLSITSTIYRDIVTPKTNEKYLKALVKHELINALNLSSDYLIDYSQIGEFVSENVKQYKLLVSAIQTNHLKEILDFFELCSMNIKRIDVANNALINYVKQNKVLSYTENSIIVDVSSKQIRQYLFENGQYSYHRVTRVNFDGINNYSSVLDAIEKMIQFSIAQGRIKKLDQIIFVGFPFKPEEITEFKADLNLNVSQIDVSKSIHFKQQEDVQLIYALSMLYKASKKKSIDLMALYNTLNRKNDLVERINPLFLPTLAFVTYIVITTLIILVIKTTNTDKAINEVNAYLTQDKVLSKMFEITESMNRTNKMNEILVEVDNIQEIIDQLPRFNQTIISELYEVKPAEISIKTISYKSSSLEIDIETLDSSLIYQYIVELKTRSYYKDIEYTTYSRNETTGIYSSTIYIRLKELE